MSARMTAGEFREAGYLQEINRLFLHPLGLSLETDFVGTEERFTGFFDHRDEPAGLFFTETIEDDAAEAAMNVCHEALKRASIRVDLLGDLIQPLGCRVEEEVLDL
jgi:hypothetical protein